MRMKRRISMMAALAGMCLLGTGSAQVLLTNQLQSGAGSTIGPDGALYVTEPSAGRVSRVDPDTGAVTPYWSGLPAAVLPIGGVMDVIFHRGNAYALVTLVGPDVGGSDIVGIYRMEGPNDATVMADIGAFSMANPPDTDYEVPTGVQYAIERYRGGLLVTDGHHNRVLWVERDGEVWELIAFDNIVPTGLEIHGRTIYMAELGPAPNLPEDGKVIAFEPRSLTPWEVGSGARMLVDVERGRGRTLYALGQGVWDGLFPGSPALPYTGTLVRIDRRTGNFTEIASGLNQPTSMEFIGNAVYIVSLAGEVWVIEDVSGPPFGR